MRIIAQRMQCLSQSSLHPRIYNYNLICVLTFFQNIIEITFHMTANHWFVIIYFGWTFIHDTCRHQLVLFCSIANNPNKYIVLSDSCVNEPVKVVELFIFIYTLIFNNVINSDSILHRVSSYSMWAAVGVNQIVLNSCQTAVVLTNSV